jgi:uncharacterized cupredoxin-like copper-binding protein
VPLALSTGHEVGLAVTAAAFMAFALASSFLFPRFRPQYPGGGLLAFIVVAVVFFFGMLAAVEVFGAESGSAESERVAETGGNEPTTVQHTTTTQQQQTSTVTLSLSTGSTSPTTTAARAQSQRIDVSESEFKIELSDDKLNAGIVTFDVKNDGKIAHDFAIKGGEKTKLIQPGGTATLTATLKAGKVHFYCSVPGHEAAGMKVDVTVS